MKNAEDVVYFASLFLCIAIGPRYRSIENAKTKRSYGTGLGVLVVCLICGRAVFHCLLMVCINIAIVKFGDRR